MANANNSLTKPVQEPEQKAAITPIPATYQKNITDKVLDRINEYTNAGVLKLPPTYIAGNALKAAWLTLQETVDKNKRPAYEVCKPSSVANSLLKMCVGGLSPAKTQCYFIIRGDQLTMMPSYFGVVAAAKRLEGVENVFAQVIYEDDVFEYAIENGNLVITKHEQKIENIDLNKIVGAYCVVMQHGQPHCELMTMKQINTSWEHRSNSGDVQREYPDQMCKRTVIKRGVKMFVNTSDDSDILCGVINGTTADEYSDGAATLGNEFTDEDFEPVALLAETVENSEETPVAASEHATPSTASAHAEKPAKKAQETPKTDMPSGSTSGGNTTEDFFN